MLYAIADLHLSLGLAESKPMDIFGKNWTEHHIKIKENWIDKVKSEDTVLIPGDLSWAMTDQEFEQDIAFVHDLPGNKIIISGNHDYWWKSTLKLNALYPDIRFLKNSFEKYKDFHICGSRGWICPNDSFFTEHDLKIYNREIGRLKFSLDGAMKDGAKHIIVMMHFPVFNDKKEPSDFVRLIQEYPVEKVIYGHLHGKGCENAVTGNIKNIEYILASADFINFDPIIIESV